MTQGTRLSLLTFAFLASLLWNTGLVSDDFVDVVQLSKGTFWQNFWPQDNFINTPVGHLTHHLWFSTFDTLSAWRVDVLKIVYTTFSVGLLTYFFRQYHDLKDSLAISLIFCLYPSHDSIPFWFAPSGHLLSTALFFLAALWLKQGKIKRASFLILFASFMVYGSTAVAAGLVVLLLAEGYRRQALWLAGLHCCYIAYFITVSIVFKAAPSRLLESNSPLTLFKQLLLQILTYLDSTMGASMGYKLYYSVLAANPWHLIIGLACLGLASRVQCETESKGPQRPLLWAMATMLVASWMMFACTGRYPQLAFNLGNRTTFWGSMLPSYLLVVGLRHPAVRTAIFTTLLVVWVGISDHWKANWTEQKRVIETFHANKEILGSLNPSEVIYVKGNQYSQLGPFSHIEFLSENWVCRALLQDCTGQYREAVAFNKNLSFRNGQLFDKKYARFWAVGADIAVFDSDTGKLERVQANDIQDALEGLPEQYRHWSQLPDSRLGKLVKNLATTLMPRLAR